MSDVVTQIELMDDAMEKARIVRDELLANLNVVCRLSDVEDMLPERMYDSFEQVRRIANNELFYSFEKYTDVHVALEKTFAD